MAVDVNDIYNQDPQQWGADLEHEDVQNFVCRIIGLDFNFRRNRA